MSGISRSRANGVVALRSGFLVWSILWLWFTSAPAQQPSDREAKLLLEKEVVDRPALQAILKVRSIDSIKDRKRASELSDNETNQTNPEWEKPFA